MNIDISNAHCGPRIQFPDHAWLRVVLTNLNCLRPPYAKLRKRRTSDPLDVRPRERDARACLRRPPSPPVLETGSTRPPPPSLASSEMTPKVCCASERSYKKKGRREAEALCKRTKSVYKEEKKRIKRKKAREAAPGEILYI